MHWLAFGLAALVTVSACDGNAATPRHEPPPSPRYEPPPRGPRFIGSRVVLRGRVVSPEGNPVPSAALQVMSMGTPHDDPEVAGETTSGVDGLFTFPAVPSDAVNFVVVRGNGGTRTYDRRAAESAEPIDLGTLIVGPERDVEFVVRCEAPGLDSADAQMQARVFDETTNELIANFYLTGPLAATRAFGPEVVPGRTRSVRFFDPAHERELRGVVPVPVGEHLLVLYGACGFTTQRLIVPAAGPARFEQTLPVQVQDASVLVTLGADACPADVHITAFVPDIEWPFSLDRRRLTCRQELALGGRIRRVEVSGDEVGPCRAWLTEGHAVRLERGRSRDCLVTPLAR